MKHTHYTCDGRNCDKKAYSLRDWLYIKADGDETFSVENNLPNRKLISASAYNSMHFCSQRCFVGKFFELKD